MSSAFLSILAEARQGDIPITKPAAARPVKPASRTSSNEGSGSVRTSSKVQTTSRPTAPGATSTAVKTSTTQSPLVSKCVHSFLAYTDAVKTLVITPQEHFPQPHVDEPRVSLKASNSSETPLIYGGTSKHRAIKGSVNQAPSPRRSGPGSCQSPLRPSHRSPAPKRLPPRMFFTHGSKESHPSSASRRSDGDLVLNGRIEKRYQTSTKHTVTPPREVRTNSQASCPDLVDQLTEDLNNIESGTVHNQRTSDEKSDPPPRPSRDHTKSPARDLLRSPKRIDPELYPSLSIKKLLQEAKYRKLQVYHESKDYLVNILQVCDRAYDELYDKWGHDHENIVFARREVRRYNTCLLKKERKESGARMRSAQVEKKNDDEAGLRLPRKMQSSASQPRASQNSEQPQSNGKKRSSSEADHEEAAPHKKVKVEAKAQPPKSLYPLQPRVPMAAIEHPRALNTTISSGRTLEKFESNLDVALSNSKVKIRKVTQSTPAAPNKHVFKQEMQQPQTPKTTVLRADKPVTGGTKAQVPPVISKDKQQVAKQGEAEAVTKLSSEAKAIKESTSKGNQQAPKPDVARVVKKCPPNPKQREESTDSTEDEERAHKRGVAQVVNPKKRSREIKVVKESSESEEESEEEVEEDDFVVEDDDYQPRRRRGGVSGMAASKLFAGMR